MQIDTQVTPGTQSTLTRSTRFTRWSGLAAMLGGLLFAIGIPLHPLRFGEAVHNSPYAAIHTLIAMSLMLALLGLVGVCVRQGERLGTIGLAGYFIAFIGHTLTLAGLMTEGFMWPAVAVYDPAAVHSFDASTPLGQAISLLTPIFLGGLVFFAIGYALLGGATMRAGILPRRAGLLVAVGAVLYAAGDFSLPILGTHSLLVTVIETSGAIPFGLGFVWMGYALWRRRPGVAQTRAAHE